MGRYRKWINGRGEDRRRERGRAIWVKKQKAGSRKPTSGKMGKNEEESKEEEIKYFK